MPSNNKAKMKILSSLITLLLQKKKKSTPPPPSKCCNAWESHLKAIVGQKENALSGPFLFPAFTSSPRSLDSVGVLVNGTWQK